MSLTNAIKNDYLLYSCNIVLFFLLFVLKVLYKLVCFEHSGYGWRSRGTCGCLWLEAVEIIFKRFLHISIPAHYTARTTHRHTTHTRTHANTHIHTHTTTYIHTYNHTHTRGCTYHTSKQLQRFAHRCGISWAKNYVSRYRMHKKTNRRGVCARLSAVCTHMRACVLAYVVQAWCVLKVRLCLCGPAWACLHVWNASE